MCFADENSNQSFLSDVYQPGKTDNNSSSTSSSQQVSPPHTSALRAEDSQPPMLGQESVDGESAPPPSLCPDFGRLFTQLVELNGPLNDVCLEGEGASVINQSINQSIDSHFNVQSEQKATGLPEQQDSGQEPPPLVGRNLGQIQTIGVKGHLR